MLRDEAGLLVGYVYVDVEPRAISAVTLEDAKARRRSADARSGRPAPGNVPALDWRIRAPRADARTDVDPRSARPDCGGGAVFLCSSGTSPRCSIVFLAILLRSWGIWLLLARLPDIGGARRSSRSSAPLRGRGVVMIVYIDHAFIRRLRAGKIRDLNDIIHAHGGHGPARQARLMTVATMPDRPVPPLGKPAAAPTSAKRIGADGRRALSSAFLTLELIPSFTRTGAMHSSGAPSARAGRWPMSRASIWRRPRHDVPTCHGPRVATQSPSDGERDGSESPAIFFRASTLPHGQRRQVDERFAVFQACRRAPTPAILSR